MFDTWVNHQATTREEPDAFKSQMKNKRKGRDAYRELKSVAAQLPDAETKKPCIGSVAFDSSHNSRLNFLLKRYSIEKDKWNVNNVRYYPAVGQNNTKNETFSLIWASDNQNVETQQPPASNSFEIVSVIVQTEIQREGFSEDVKEFLKKVRDSVSAFSSFREGKDGHSLENQRVLFHWLFEKQQSTLEQNLAKVIRSCLDETQRTKANLRIAISAEDIASDKDFDPVLARQKQSTRQAIETLDSFFRFAQTWRIKSVDNYIVLPADDFQTVSMDFVGDHVKQDFSFEIVHVISDTRPNFVQESSIEQAVKSLHSPARRIGIRCQNPSEQDFWTYVLGRWALRSYPNSTILSWECHDSRSEELLFPVHESLRKLIGLGFGQDLLSSVGVGDPHQRLLLSWLSENVTRAHVPLYLQTLEVFLLSKPIEKHNVKKIGLHLSGLLEELSKLKPLVVIVSDIEHADPATKDLFRSLLKMNNVILLATSEGELELVDFDLDVQAIKNGIGHSTSEYEQLFESLTVDEKEILEIARCLEWNSLRSWVRNIWLLANPKRTKDDYERCVNNLMTRKLLRASGQLKDYWNKRIYREIRFSSRQVFSNLDKLIKFDVDSSRKIFAKRFESLLVEHFSDPKKDARSVRQKFQVLRYLDMLDPHSIDEKIVEYLPELSSIVAKRFSGYSPNLVTDRLETIRTICFSEQKGRRKIPLNQKYSIISLTLDHISLDDPSVPQVLSEANELLNDIVDQEAIQLSSEAKFDFVRAFWALRFKQSEYSEARRLAGKLNDLLDDPSVKYSIEHNIEFHHVHVVTAFFTSDFSTCIEHGTLGKEKCTNGGEPRRVLSTDELAYGSHCGGSCCMILHAFALFLNGTDIAEVSKLADDAEYFSRDENSQQIVAAFYGMLLVSAKRFGDARRKCYDAIVRWTNSFGGRWNLFARQVFLSAAIAQLSKDQSQSSNILHEFQQLFDFQSSQNTLMVDLYISLKSICDDMAHIDKEGNSFFNCFLAVGANTAGELDEATRHWLEAQQCVSKGESFFSNCLQDWAPSEQTNISRGDGSHTNPNPNFGKKLQTDRSADQNIDNS